MTCDASRTVTLSSQCCCVDTRVTACGSVLFMARLNEL
jgi:hypothetical protein